MLINIHGGPEGQSRPGFLGRNNYYVNEMGVAILFPNVRGSTGYGKTFVALAAAKADKARAEAAASLATGRLTQSTGTKVAAFEEAMSILEAGEGASAFASGMAALHAALSACDLTPGSTVLASQDLYGATLGLLNHIFAPAGVKTVTADFNDLDEVREKAMAVKPKALVAETISNPLLKVCDLHGCAVIAREAGAMVTDLGGAPCPVAHTSVLAANPKMHGWLLERLTVDGGR